MSFVQMTLSGGVFILFIVVVRALAPMGRLSAVGEYLATDGISDEEYPFNRRSHK